MAELLLPSRFRRSHETIRVSAELSGLTLTDQPIPWNAEAVNIVASLRLSSAFVRKEDVALRLPGHEPILPVVFRHEESPTHYFMVFRVPTPKSTVDAELICENRVLARVPLKVLTREEFQKSLQLESEVVHVRLDDESVACQAIVAAQCHGLIASGKLSATTSLAPLAELGLSVEFRGDNGEPALRVRVPLSAAQFLARETFVVAVPRKLSRRARGWSITWLAGKQVLAVSRVRSIRPAELRQTLRVVGAKFVVDDGKTTTIRRQAPAPGEAVRVGPCFLVSSTEPGLAAKCEFEVVARGIGSSPTVGPWRTSVLITDGPTSIVAGMLPASELAGLQSFDLRFRGHTIGQLPLHPVPVAAFTAEGGFETPPDFYWTPTAEEELNERLSKLMEG